MSTSSSDSLEYSQSPGFSLGSSPSQHLNHQEPVEDSSEEDEDGEDEEEEDYGVGLETDLEMRLRPSYKAQRLKVGVSLSGGSFVFHRALKGRFRKVSGMLRSLMTPEKRAVKRIAELSRDKSSYFGSLVQDYNNFVQENRSCHTSGMDFLQTLRQFITQTKAYLRQSSELDPPIESLIPEDQIGKSAKQVEKLKKIEKRGFERRFYGGFPDSLKTACVGTRSSCFSHLPLIVLIVSCKDAFMKIFYFP